MPLSRACSKLVLHPVRDRLTGDPLARKESPANPQSSRNRELSRDAAGRPRGRDALRKPPHRRRESFASRCCQCQLQQLAKTTHFSTIVPFPVPFGPMLIVSGVSHHLSASFPPPHLPLPAPRLTRGNTSRHARLARCCLSRAAHSARFASTLGRAALMLGPDISLPGSLAPGDAHILAQRPFLSAH